MNVRGLLFISFCNDLKCTQEIASSILLTSNQLRELRCSLRVSRRGEVSNQQDNPQ